MLIARSSIAVRQHTSVHTVVSDSSRVLVEQPIVEWFCQQICHVILTLDVGDENFGILDTLPNKMVSPLDMASPRSVAR
eukprot:1951012-Rhodomonas_salina.1